MSLLLTESRILELTRTCKVSQKINVILPFRGADHKAVQGIQLLEEMIFLGGRERDSRNRDGFRPQQKSPTSETERDAGGSSPVDEICVERSRHTVDEKPDGIAQKESAEKSTRKIGISAQMQRIF